MSFWGDLFSIDGAKRMASNYRRRAKTYIDKNGYKRFSNSDILVSRSVVEKKLGRKLDDEEVVHHRNRNKLDNRPKNLWACSDQDEHEYYHKKDGDLNKRHHRKKSHSSRSKRYYKNDGFW